MQIQPAMPTGPDALDPAVQREIVGAVEAARPIGDLLGWLIAEYPDADRDWIFAALKAIYAEGFEIGPASQQTRIYKIRREVLTAYPQRVT